MTNTEMVWAKIEKRVQGKVRASVSNLEDAKEVFQEIATSFWARKAGEGYTEGQAYFYATTDLYREALRECGIVTSRVTVGNYDDYSAAIAELGETPDRNELQEIEDTYRPHASFTSYEGLVEEGWDQAAPEVDPLNNSGLDERIAAFLANPSIDPMAKAMALQILDGSTVKEVAKRHGVSIQTVTRTLASQSVKLPQEFRYVINQVKLAKPGKAAPAVVEFEETIDLSFFDEEPVAEITAPVAETVEVETAEIPTPVQVAEVINLADSRADHEEVVHASEASLHGKEAPAKVVSLAEHRTRITKAAAQDATHRAAAYHAFQQAESPPPVPVHLTLTGPRAPSFGYADGYCYPLRYGT